jgi:hypothetical protein
MLISELVEALRSGRLLQDTYPSVDLPQVFESSELVELKWEPWRACASGMVRLLDDRHGDVAVVFAREVTAFSYENSDKRWPGFGSRLVEEVQYGGDQAGVEATFMTAPKERMSFRCGSLEVATVQAGPGELPLSIPDYSVMDESAVEGLQPTLFREVELRTFTHVGNVLP